MTERVIERHLGELKNQHPEALPFNRVEAVEEVGQVLPSKPRPTDNITGKEIVIRSHKTPISVAPLLEETAMQLHEHRADTHRRLAHKVSNAIAYVTGSIDGVTDGVINGTGELVENGVFLVSKVVHSVKHGWARGRFENSQGE